MNKYIKYEDLTIFYEIDDKKSYPPQEDSFLLADIIKTKVAGKIVLDLGCGSGIQGLIAKKYGARFVTFADKDPDAIYIAKYNYLLNFRNIKDVEFVLSDLFSNINRKYDLVIFNPPYLPKTGLEDSKTELWTVGGERGTEILELFLKDLYKFLKKDGKAYIVHSSLSDPFYTFRKFIQLYSIKTVARRRFFFEELYVYEISRKI